GIFVHKNAGTVSMPKIDDFDRYALLAQRHRHRREDESRASVTGEIRFFQFGPAVEANWIEDVVTGEAAVNEVRHRTGKVAGDWKITHSEFFASLGAPAMP